MLLTWIDERAVLGARRAEAGGGSRRARRLTQLRSRGAQADTPRGAAPAPRSPPPAAPGRTVRNRGDYQYAGRTRLVMGTVRRPGPAPAAGPGPAQPLDALTGRPAFGVGVLYGTGAETPTQVVLFASAGDGVILLAFLAGQSSWPSQV